MLTKSWKKRLKYLQEIPENCTINLQVDTIFAICDHALEKNKI